jgi:hypothetical protein
MMGYGETIDFIQGYQGTPTQTLNLTSVKFRAWQTPAVVLIEIGEGIGSGTGGGVPPSGGGGGGGDAGTGGGHIFMAYALARGIVPTLLITPAGIPPAIATASVSAPIILIDGVAHTTVAVPPAIATAYGTVGFNKIRPEAAMATADVTAPIVFTPKVVAPPATATASNSTPIIILGPQSIVAIATASVGVVDSGIDVDIGPDASLADASVDAPIIQTNTQRKVLPPPALATARFAPSPEEPEDPLPFFDAPIIRISIPSVISEATASVIAPIISAGVLSPPPAIATASVALDKATVTIRPLESFANATAFAPIIVIT